MIDARIIIVDDDRVVRAKLRLLVESLGAEVVGEAGDGLAGIEQAGRFHPDILLLDVSMPVMGGFQAARHIRDSQPDVRIIFLSQWNQKVYAEEAFKLGARGYVVKGAAVTELGEAVKTVMAGETFVSPSLAA